MLIVLRLTLTSDNTEYNKFVFWNIGHLSKQKQELRLCVDFNFQQKRSFECQADFSTCSDPGVFTKNQREASVRLPLTWKIGLNIWWLTKSFSIFFLPKAIQQKILQKNLLLSDSLSFLCILLPAIRRLSVPLCLYRSYLQQSVSLRSRCLKTTMWSTARCSTDRKSRAELGFWAWIKRGRPWRATGSKRPNQLRISCLNL